MGRHPQMAVSALEGAAEMTGVRFAATPAPPAQETPMSRLSSLPLSLRAHCRSGRSRVPAPTALVIVACRVDDLTGQRGGRIRGSPRAIGRPRASRRKNQESNASASASIWTMASRATTSGAAAPLNPDFGDWSQCARGARCRPATDRKHPGWGVVAVGCPTDRERERRGGRPEAARLPHLFPGTTSRMRRRFDAA